MTLLELMGVRDRKSSKPYETTPYDTWSSTEWGWEFRTDSGKRYAIMIDLPSSPGSYKPISNNLLEVVFALVTGSQVGDSGGQTTEIVPTGSITETARIFSTVLAVCRKVNQKQKPLVWMFSAEEPSRKKLYQKLVNSLAPQLGAQVKIMHDEGIEYYFLVKPGPEAQKIVSKVAKAYELKK